MMGHRIQAGKGYKWRQDWNVMYDMLLEKWLVLMDFLGGQDDQRSLQLIFFAGW